MIKNTQEIENTNFEMKVIFLWIFLFIFFLFFWEFFEMFVIQGFRDILICESVVC